MEAGGGINAINVPYNREQQRLEQQFQHTQAQALADHRAWQRADSDRKFAYDTDPNNPANIRKPYSDIGKLEHDRAAGYIPEDYTPEMAGPFSGNSVQAQALNWLVGHGSLTREQAAQVAAGRPVTGPNGEQLFFTPEQIINAANAGRGNQTPGAPVTGNPAPTSLFNQGSPTPTPQRNPMQLTGSKPPTPAQSKAYGFVARLAEAIPIIEKNESAGLSYAEQAKSLVPVFGNALVSGNFQNLDQASRDFINATLRRESGAAIGKDEFVNARLQYIPLPGDSPLTLRQKAISRRNIYKALALETGGRFQIPELPAYQGAGQPAQPVQFDDDLNARLGNYD